ncbi:hypothetical protein BJ165DRAFT_1316855, partial [Panaeolus papilionaceus]
SLPILNDLCHCTTCRHASGQLAVYHVSMLGPPLASASPNISRNRDYRTSPGVTRLFCRACSAQLFFIYTPSQDETLANSTAKSRQAWKWCVAGGALERTAGIVKLGHHIWVGDTFDGGMADHLQVVDGVQMSRFREGMNSDEVMLGWRKDVLQGEYERLPLYCHCGSVRLLVTRPTYESTMLYAPFPDILCPSDSRLSKRRNPRDLKWWLRPPLGHPVPSNTDPHKNAIHATRYLAGHCMCSICRLTSGMEVQSWLWIPDCNVLDARTEKENMEGLYLPSGRLKVLTQYTPSPGRYRESCSKCGANILLWSTQVPALLCVAAGLIDENYGHGGARAEAWFDWYTERVAFIEEAL